MAKARTVGIIGLGFGRAHIPAFQANGCEVVAVCQRNVESAQQLAKQYGIPQVFERWEEMLDKARPEIVVIASPPDLHRDVALRAFDGGAHVLCEKPLAMDAAQCRAMVEAAARAKRTAMTCFNWRFPAAMRQLHELVEAGQLGRLFHVNMRWLGSRWADEGAAATWRMDRAQAGHGAMGDMGVHVIDLLRWHFGELTRVKAAAGIAHPSRQAPGGRPTDAEDFCSVIGELASGALVSFTVSRAARGANDQTLEAYGSAGALRYSFVRQGKRWHLGALEAATSGGFEPVKVKAGLPHSAGEGDQLEVIGKATIGPLVKRFLKATRKGQSPSPSFEDGLRAQLVLDAVLRAQRDGGWVPVETGSPSP
ncbi:MAG TPA: Gfo/Idh/MocA family oxidoreductase [Methylomirabilota bacterium]|nr:Gfo/Idh/MocA family oxidoreductase [Methylomirabilota bacterium]